MSVVIGRRRYLTNFEAHRLPHLFTDVLVLGSGIAGLQRRCARRNAPDVLLVTKDRAEQSATWYAQAASRGHRSGGHTGAKHALDTLDVACGLGSRGVHPGRQMAEAPAFIKALVDGGARFDRVGECSMRGAEGGHTFFADHSCARYNGAPKSAGPARAGPRTAAHPDLRAVPGHRPPDARRARSLFFSSSSSDTRTIGTPIKRIQYNTAIERDRRNLPLEFYRFFILQRIWPLNLTISIKSSWLWLFSW